MRDAVCPWCYIGKRRFEKALAGFEHRNHTAVLWRSFELDPEAAQAYSGSLDQMLAEKYWLSLERAEQLIDSWRIHCRVHRYLLDR
jgi:predicted DsbA family dithiol-disulfide isomerase